MTFALLTLLLKIGQHCKYGASVSVFFNSPYDDNPLYKLICSKLTKSYQSRKRKVIQQSTGRDTVQAHCDLDHLIHAVIALAEGQRVYELFANKQECSVGAG